MKNSMKKEIGRLSLTGRRYVELLFFNCFVKLYSDFVLV